MSTNEMGTGAASWSRVWLLAFVLLIAGCGVSERVGEGPGHVVQRSAPVTDPPRSNWRESTVTVLLDGDSCRRLEPVTVADPRLVHFVVLNRTGGTAVFDLGKITKGHTFEHLVRDVRAGTSRIDGITDANFAAARPSYFRGSIEGSVGQGHISAPGTSLLRTGIAPTTWEPYPHSRASVGTWAIVCYRISDDHGHVDLEGIAGPVEVSDGTYRGTPSVGVYVGTTILTSSGCRWDPHAERVDARYLRFVFRNRTGSRAAFAVGRLTGTRTLEGLQSDVQALRREGVAWELGTSVHGEDLPVASFDVITTGASTMGNVILGPFNPAVVAPSSALFWNGPGGGDGPAEPGTYAVICLSERRDGRFQPIAAVGAVEVRGGP